MTLQRFDRATLPATRWKNGGGVTREIVCNPPGAGLDGFDWRVSIAEVAGDGPFSAFQRVDRVITLLEGAGMRLHATDGRFDHRLDQPLVPFAFAGEAPVQCELLAGACQDFNVMTRRGRCRAEVRLLARSTALPAAAGGLLLALRGQWRAGAQALAPGEGLWWSGGEGPGAPSCEDSHAALLAVHIHPVKP